VKAGAVVLDRDNVRVVEDVVYGSVFFEDGTVTGLKWAEIHVSPVQPGDKLRFGGGPFQEVTGVQRNLSDTDFQVKYRLSDANRSWSPEYVLDLDTAKKYLVKPLGVGDYVTSLSSGDPVPVTRIDEENNRAWYRDPEFGEIWGDIDNVARRKVQEKPVSRDKPFPKGSKVRFRNDVTYTAGDWDGELQELVPDDGSETLQFGPDLFELVAGPPLKPGTVVEDETHDRFLVDYEAEGLVELTDRTGGGRTMSRSEFDESYKILLD